MKNWLDTVDFEDALARSREFDASLREQVVSGEARRPTQKADRVFWPERVRELIALGDEAAALDLAIRHLPLPGAFAAAAAIWRTRVRRLRRSKGDWRSALLGLYRLAALASLSVPYSEAVRQSGFHVAQVIPGVVLRGLHVDYQALGYRELTLLNATDVKWLVEAFGEPREHSTVHRIHHAVWAEYERRLLEWEWAPDSRM